jgi:hypothetical protein
MNIQSVIALIKKKSFILSGLDEKELVYLQDVIKAIQMFVGPPTRGIYWSTEDFESVARGAEVMKMEEAGENQVLIEQVSEHLVPIPLEYLTYDRLKFDKTLDLMIQEHDAGTGINWDIIRHYLDTHCKFQDEPVDSEPTDGPGHPSEEAMGRTALDFLSRAVKQRTDAPGDTPVHNPLPSAIQPGKVDNGPDAEVKGPIHPPV